MCHLNVDARWHPGAELFTVKRR